MKRSPLFCRLCSPIEIIYFSLLKSRKDSDIIVTLRDKYITKIGCGFMRHKVTRLIIGAIWVVVSIVLFVKGNSLQGGLFLLVGAVFIYSGFKNGKDNKK